MHFRVSPARMIDTRH